jgi:hypothetical protein
MRNSSPTGGGDQRSWWRGRPQAGDIAASETALRAAPPSSLRDATSPGGGGVANAEPVQNTGRSGSPSATGVWMPHSVLSQPAQRPERGSSPGFTLCVQGAQPIEG